MPINRAQRLYRQLIMDAARPETTWGTVPEATPVHHAVNPSCGDVLDLQVVVTDGTLTGIHVTATGCTISQASASLMVRAVAGQSRADVQQRIVAFDAGIVAGTPMPKSLGDAAALASVHDFPARVKCALLAWHTLGQALNEQEGIDASHEEQPE